jgi:phosphoserine aminotransferase
MCRISPPAPVPSARLESAKSQRRRPRPFASREDRQGEAQVAIELTREVLEVPADYKIGIVPASDRRGQWRCGRYRCAA